MENIKDNISLIGISNEKSNSAIVEIKETVSFDEIDSESELPDNNVLSYNKLSEYINLLPNEDYSNINRYGHKILNLNDLALRLYNKLSKQAELFMFSLTYLKSKKDNLSTFNKNRHSMYCKTKGKYYLI